MAVDVRDLLRQLRERQTEQEERTTVQVQTGDPFDRLLEKAQEQRATRPPMVDELLGMAARNIVAGVGDFLSGLAGGLELAYSGWQMQLPMPQGAPPAVEPPPMYPGDLAVQLLRAIGPRLSAVGTPPAVYEGLQSIVDPRFLATTGARVVGTSLPLMFAGAGVGSLLRGAHPIVQALVAGGSSRALEGLVEAESVYQQALSSGMSDEEARLAAGRTFAANLGLTGADAAQFALAFLPIGRQATTAVGRALQAAGRVAGSVASEAAEEGVQEAIQRWALEQPIEFDQQMQQAMALGGLLGGVFGVGGQVAQALAPGLMRAEAEPGAAQAQTAPGQAVTEPVQPVATAQAPVLQRFRGRTVTRFDLTRLAPEEQRVFIETPEADLEAIGISLAEQARTYLQHRFRPEYEQLIGAWEAAGVPDEVIARAIQRTDPRSLAERQRNLRRGVVDLPMYQPGGWVRVRVGQEDFQAAQRAFIDAGRPRGLVDLTRRVEQAAEPEEPAQPSTATTSPEPGPAAPVFDPAAWWDGLDAAGREEAARAAGWVTRSGELNQIGRRVVRASWSELSETARRVLMRQHQPRLQEQFQAQVEAATRARQAAAQPTTESEPSSTQAVVAWWDSLDSAGREAAVRSVGWLTRQGDISALGRAILNRNWEQLPQSAQRKLTRYWQESLQAQVSADTGSYVPGTAATDRLPQAETVPQPAQEVAQPQAETPTFRIAATGTESTARTERGTAVETRWAVVEADELITSHDTALRPDPRFPQELQPRDRGRLASELQISRIVQQLEPEFLGENPKASEGAPIVGPDGIVESGNARIIALKRIYEQGHPNQERYRSWLLQNAQRFGLDPAAIQQMRAPVLVRVRETEVDRQRFVREANEAAVASMSATEQAMADARALTPEVFSLFVPSDTGEIVTPENRVFIAAFFKEVVPPAELGRYMRPDGTLSVEGITRLRNAIFARAYGDPGALMALAEDTDSNIRNITGAMVQVAPRFAVLQEQIRAGWYHNLDITPEIAQAARKLSQLRAQRETVENYLSQTTMFGDDLSPLAKAILEVFSRYGRSRKRLTEIFQTYADMVEAAGHPAQASLFGETQAPSKDSVLRAAVEEVEQRYGRGVAGQTGMEILAGQSERDLPAEATVPAASTAAEPERPADPQAGGSAAVQAETRGLPAAAVASAAHERPQPSSPGRVITRKEAIDFLEKEFLMPVREGRLPIPGARGTFNLRTHVTRLRRAEDFRALTHEFGHFLSETMPLNPENYPELEPMGAALYPNADWKLKREEGAAEFFYLYFSRPEEARAAAPAFYADFEARLDADPAFKAKIRQAQELLMAQFNQTGTAAIKAAIVREDAKDVPFLTPLQRFYTNWIDDLHPIWQLMKVVLGEENVRSEWNVKLSQNPYILGRLARGRFRKAHAMLTRAQISPSFERVGPSLQEILQPVAANIEDFEAYLVALRAVELHRRGINPGVRLEDAQAAIAELERTEFREAQQQLVEYQNNLLEHLVDAGVISAQQAEKWREINQFYVPFYRYFGEETVARGMAGGGVRWGDLPRPVKAIRGSTRSIYSPLQSIIRNTITFIDIAERNRAARALYELTKNAKGIGWLVEEVPAPMEADRVQLEQLKRDLVEAGIPKDILEEADLERMALVFRPVSHARWKEKRENILTVYVNGRPRFLQLHPELYRAMQFLDQPAANWFFRLLSAPTRLLRAGAILNPEFVLRNPVRDQMSALMHRKYRFVPVIDPARAIFHLFRGEAVGGDELYDLWVASGGAQSTFVSLDREYLEADLRRLLGNETAKERAVKIIRSPLTALEFISQTLEEATRLAQFRRGLEAEGRGAEGIRRAAYASREVSVDFQRAGVYGRQANQIKAFFNAAIQGTDQMARLWKQDPVGYTARAFLYITLPSIVLYLLNKDDPRYQELPRWRRDMYWVIMGEDEVVFIPKPFELGVIFGTLPERILEWLETNDPAAFRDFEDTLFSSVLPGDPRTPVDWLPDMFTPIIEVWANRNAFTDQPIVPRSEQDLLPEAQYGPSTTQAAKTIGRLFGVSPRYVEHIIYGYTGTLGRQALRLLDRLAGVESVTPILRPFTGDLYVSAISLDEFYETLARLEQMQRTQNEMQRRGQPVAYPVNEAELRYMRQVRDQLAELRRMNRMVLENPRLSVEEKRQIINSISLRMVNLARLALGKQPIPEE